MQNVLYRIKFQHCFLLLCSSTLAINEAATCKLRTCVLYLSSFSHSAPKRQTVYTVPLFADLPQDILSDLLSPPSLWRGDCILPGSHQPVIHYTCKCT